MQAQILLFFQDHGNSFFDFLANFFTMFGEQNLIVAISLFIFWCVDKKKGFAICSVLLFSLVGGGIFKAITKVPRPFQVMPQIQGKRLSTATGYSFPSGHTTCAASFFSSTAMAFRKRWISISCSLLIILVGISRMYLGVHWPTDVAGGLILGILTSILFFTMFYQMQDKDIYAFCMLFGPLGSAVALVMAALLTLGRIDVTAYTDLMKTLAILGGSYFGFAMESKFIHFKVEGTILRKILRYVVGMLGVLLIMLLKKVFPQSMYYVGAFIRYTLLGLWATALYPLLGKRLFSNS